MVTTTASEPFIRASRIEDPERIVPDPAAARNVLRPVGASAGAATGRGAWGKAPGSASTCDPSRPPVRGARAESPHPDPPRRPRGGKTFAFAGVIAGRTAV